MPGLRVVMETDDNDIVCNHIICRAYSVSKSVVDVVSVSVVAAVCVGVVAAFCVGVVAVVAVVVAAVVFIVAGAVDVLSSKQPPLAEWKAPGIVAPGVPRTTPLTNP